MIALKYYQEMHEVLIEIIIGELVKASFVAITRVKEKLRHKRKLDVKNYKKLYNLWRDINQKILNEGDYIKVEGTLSNFIPLLPGNPETKIKLHRKFRRYFTPDVPQKLVDFFLALTSGQLAYYDNRNLYGFYNCIVRNSALVFIDDAVNVDLMDMFKERTALEVVLTGELKFVKSSDIFPDLMNQMEQLFSKYKLRELHDLYKTLLYSEIPIIYVDNKSDIEIIDETKYLDGDIWLFIEDSSSSKWFISRFLNLADIDEVQNETKGLISDAYEQFNMKHVLKSFDSTGKFIDISRFNGF